MIYLIHFDRPYRHAQHYRGYCEDDQFEARMARHRAGRGARLLAVIQAAGIGWRCVRTWPGADRRAERNLKKRGVGWICPICNPKLCISTGE